MEGHQKNPEGSDQRFKHADELDRDLGDSGQPQHREDLRDILIQQLRLHSYRVKICQFSLCDGG